MVKNKYGDCTIVAASADHINDIAVDMRAEDAFECACFGLSPHQALRLAYQNDDVTYTALDKDDKPFLMFGAGRGGSAFPYIWLLGTPGVFNNSRQFLRASKEWVNHLVKPYNFVSNMVCEQNTAAIRWLKFCGAKFVRKLNVRSTPFYEFIITNI